MVDISSQIQAAAAALRAGGAAVFPTDTVYGIGVAVGPAQSPARLFEIKRRDEGKPVAWLVESPDDLDRYGSSVPAWAQELAQRHWPGALTLIVHAAPAVPRAFASQTGTIGLRMPASEVALGLLHAVGVPLATTSANISGEPAVACDAALDERVVCAADAVLRGWDCPGGCASTVVDCTGDEPRVLRQGTVVIG